MSAIAVPTPRRAVHLRIADQFAPAYLTLASIIQGVALASLVTRVEPNAAGYSLADWVRATASLVVILAIWHEYLMMVLAYVWLPTLLDSTVPFAFLVAEVFTIHFLPSDQRGWLAAIGAFTQQNIQPGTLQLTIVDAGCAGNRWQHQCVGLELTQVDEDNAVGVGMGPLEVCRHRQGQSSFSSAARTG